MYTLIGAISCRTRFALHHFGQVYAVGHVAILHKFEHDIAFRRIGIKALIALFIVFLNQDNRVFALSHIEIVARAVHSQCVSFHSVGLPTSWQGIGMHRYKEVGLIAIGYFGSFFQSNKNIGGARVNHLYVGAISLHVSPEGHSHVQVDVLFFRERAQSACVFPSVSWVDNQHKLFVCSICGKRQKKQQYEKGGNLFVHTR